MDDPDRLYLTILRGPDPGSADAVLATENQELIRRVAREIAEDVGGLSDASLRRLEQEPEEGSDR